MQRKARQPHSCPWCPNLIEKGEEYFDAGNGIRYHLACREKRRTSRTNTNPVRSLAWWFVEVFLKQTFSWNLHKRHLAIAKRFLNPKLDGEPQRSFTLEEVKGCLCAMRDGYFGKPVYVTSIGAVALTNFKTGNTYIEDYLEVPPMPPTYKTMELRAWLDKYGDRIDEDQLEQLKAIAFPR